MTATLTPPPLAQSPPAQSTVTPASAPFGGLPVGPAGPPSLEVQAFRAGLVRFTFADLERMWQAGILYEDSTIELLGGLLVYRDCGGTSGIGGNRTANQGRSGVAGREHDQTLRLISKSDRLIDTADRHLVTQLTLIASDSYEPIPDALILRGPPAAYGRRQPTGSDVLCLIEVSDSSYARDSGEKLAAYAAAGVPQYVILDLRRRVAEVYAGPDRAAGTYPPPTVVPADGLLPLRVDEDGRTVDVPLADLLP